VNPVRAGNDDDARFAAELHAAEISEGFLPSLGRPFLERLYRRIVREPRSFLLVAELDEQVIGFLAGTEDVRALYRAFLLHDGAGATLAALPRVLRSWRRVLETLRYPGSGQDGAPTGQIGEPLPAAELLAIAVAPTARGLGAGRALVDAFTRELVVRRVPAARVVVGAGNAVAIRLYERSGFLPARRIEVHRGTPSKVLTWR
jgi:ribosomal protein S18 acetylase RimI-like enzyme